MSNPNPTHVVTLTRGDIENIRNLVDVAMQSAMLNRDQRLIAARYSELLANAPEVQQPSKPKPELVKEDAEPDAMPEAVQ